MRRPEPQRRFGAKRDDPEGEEQNSPVYPELARRMSIAGVVKVQITVSTNGLVKETKLLGGHPLLASAALEAVRKWRYETSNEESTGIVEFRFDPTQ